MQIWCCISECIRQSQRTYRFTYCWYQIKS